MQFFKTVLSERRAFLFSFLLISSAAFIFFGAGYYIPLNTTHPFWLNVFFINYTFMGDSIFAVGLVAFYFFLLKKQQTALLLLTSFLLSEAIVQFIKNDFTFTGFKVFFEAGQYLFFSDDMLLNKSHSFPSGHTAIAFSLATILIAVSKNKARQAAILLCALLLAVSRMYLAQAFVYEVVAGSFIGAISGLFVFYGTKIYQSRKKLFKMTIFKNPADPVSGIKLS